MIRFLSLTIFLSLLISAPLAAQDDKRPPEPTDVELETRDGVQLKATYFPSKLGKKAAPIIIVPGWEDRRGEFAPLAASLQAKGFAVIVPDLRGQGDSVRQKFPGRDRLVTIRADRMTKRDIAAMIEYDMQAVKKFLFEKNNAGELNIELLTVVGSEFGSTIALNWAAKDWSWAQLPQKKQGRDVKALVLISPDRSFKGVHDGIAITHPAIQRQLSMLILVGARSNSERRDATNIFKSIEKFRDIPEDPQERVRNQDIFFLELDTSLQGATLAVNPGFQMDDKIAKFIYMRLLSKLETNDRLAWKDRS